MHRAMRTWNTKMRPPEYMYTLDEGNYNQRLFALHNTGTKAVTSIAELDEATARGLALVREQFGTTKWYVFLARLRSTWTGPRDLTPNRIPTPPSVAKATPEGSPKGIRNLCDYSSESELVEVDHEVMELHDMNGNAVMPPHRRNDGWFTICSGFVQKDFLSLDPDKEETKRSKKLPFPCVKQTWYTNTLFLVPPGYIRHLVQDAIQRTMLTLFLIPRLALYLLDTALDSGHDKLYYVRTFNDARAMIHILLKHQEAHRVDTAIHTKMLKFALKQNDVKLFTKVSKALRKGRSSPDVEFFTWLRDYLQNGKGLKFAAIKAPLKDVAECYSELHVLLDALDSPTLRQSPPANAPNPEMIDWISALLSGPNSFVRSLLRSSKDGALVFDVVWSTNYVGPQFLNEMILSPIPDSQGFNHPAWSACGSNYWVLGFLARVSGEESTLHPQSSVPVSMFRHLGHHFAHNSRIWEDLDCDETTEGGELTSPLALKPQELARFLGDLARYECVETWKKLLSAIMSRTEHIITQDYHKGDRRAQFRHFWVPLLHEMISISRASAVQILPQHDFETLFSSVLTAYATVYVGYRPPLEPDDLATTVYEPFSLSDPNKE
ncbi:hypothetical protein B0T19DRAFT_4049 [Cercophora scortea]|uniref:Uncharacterized protein n=1 Tax=Cercophora scortea TaxID=314031 RepID=A0AAE0MKR7_9PEZI|nr:hypothetical protein B0T19DRAFT_4049 [Cercophora scortea]